MKASVLIILAMIMIVPSIVGSSEPNQPVTDVVSVDYIGIDPSLKLEYAGNYTINATVTSGGTVTNAYANMSGINGEGGLDWEYFANGTTYHETVHSEVMINTGGDNWEVDVLHDNIYPRLMFAHDTAYMNNTPSEISVTRSNYHLMHFDNPFATFNGTNLWIELDASPVSTSPSVKDLRVYLIGAGETLDYFNSTDWRAKARQEKLLAEQTAEKKRFQEEQQQAIQRFYSNKEEHIQNLMSLIEQRKFDQYSDEIKKYDIPELKKELAGVKKYLEEIKLYDSAKSIPATEFGKNYEVYLKLNQFDSKNQIYLSKLKEYRMKYAQQNYEIAADYVTKKKRVRSDLAAAITAIDKAIQVEGEKKKFAKVRYQLKNAELLFYEGNNKLQMAVRNDGLTKGATGGQRKIYVWLKNVGDTPYFINVDYFTLVGKNNKRYSYNNCSRELIVNLQPGQETSGFLYFYTSSQPSELVFNHINAGKISRKFP